MRTIILASGFLAVMLLAPQGAMAQGGKAYCLKTQAGAMNCLYDTMAQCEATRKGQTNHQCMKNPKM